MKQFHNSSARQAQQPEEHRHAKPIFEMGPHKNHPGIDKEYGVIHASETLPQRNPFEPQARNIKGRIERQDCAAQQEAMPEFTSKCT